MEFKKSKTIKNLEIKAKKNNISAKFQLFQHWKNGQFVERNKSIANEYLAQVLEESKHFNFRFNKLRVLNFRRFVDLTLDTSDSNLIVIIGNNGSGKTTLLEAIAKSLSWFVNNFLREDTTGQKIALKDISELNQASFATIKSTIQYSNNNECNVELTKPKASNDEGLQGDYAEIKLLADMYRYINANIPNFNLPMIAYYPVERTQNLSQIQPNKIDKISSENWSSVDGYELSLSSHQNFNRFLGWYRRLSLINLYESNDYKKLKGELNSLQSVIKTIESSKGSEDINVINKMINEFRDKINIIQEKIRTLKKPSNTLVENINKAIMEFMPDISDLRYEITPEDGFFVVKSDVKLEAKQLSQGERTLIALVGDIARRLILLNPSKVKPLHGNGVILIDEIELHIHPRWQQNVLTNLSKVFPNIQFIVTTHSPQVLSSIDVKSIRKLEENNEGDITLSTPTYQTKGVTSADILAQIMETNSVPDVKEARELTLLLGFIEQGIYERPEAIELFNSLKLHFGESHPEIQHCKNQIKLHKMKSKAQALIKKNNSNEKA